MDTVLIVEDSQISRQMLRSILSQEYQVLEASDGGKALEILKQQHLCISAVVLDLFMPEIDGFAVLEQMQASASLSQIPVVIATAANDAETEVRALTLGASDFISKPYNPALLRHCLHNIIGLRKAAAIAKTAQLDKLTGLYTREAFLEQAAALLGQQEPGYYLMACWDINDFKVINDQYGSMEGDRILQHIGSAAKELYHAVGGICSRISADNFAALYPNTAQAVDHITRFQDTVLAPADTRATVKLSIGRYVVTDLSLPISAIYDRAFLAKQSIKGRYDVNIAYFSESMREALIRKQSIIADMDAALAQDQFEVWFQPQYDHTTGTMVGSEALVRWRHPEKGLIPPNTYIPIFEQNGFIYEMDKYVWTRCCRYLRKWTDQGVQPLPVSVNISRHDVFRDDFFQVITGLVEQYGIPRIMLRLEITESAFAQDAEHIISIVKRLIDSGFTVEIDDFGSGYSSLNTLKDVPAQVLKLDMRFLRQDANIQRGGSILESIVRMAKWLGMHVIAEGVETLAQADYLESIGCSCVQGYLYARPMPAADFEELMQDADMAERMLALKASEAMRAAGSGTRRAWTPLSLTGSAAARVFLNIAKAG